MFQKLVAIEPVSLIPSAEEALHQYAREVVLFRDVPADADEIVRRIGDADAVLLSYTSRMGRDIIARCPNLRYIGMCCSLYDEQSANVDIPCCREKGIAVAGIRDYGDPGVTEFGISRLVDLLHGFGEHQWKERPTELTGVATEILDPRDTYADAADWDVKAKDLASRFVKNFVKYEGNEAGKALVAAGPQL